MKVICEPSLELPLITMTVVFRVGATSDPPGREGLARVTARMLRRGADGLTARQVEEGIDALGGEMTSDVGLGTTSFGFEVIERNADAFVELASRVLGQPTFSSDELGKLLRESTSELVEARDNDQGLGGRAFRRAVFEGHLYARRASGYVTTLPGLTPADARAFYERHYNKQNAVVAFSGDVTPERATELAERLLSRLPEGEATPDPVSEPEQVRGRRLVFVDKPERTQTQMYIGALGSRPDDEDHIPLHVAATIFGGTFTARLMREVRSKRGWSYGAYARLPIALHRETFSLWTAPAAKDAAACLSLELDLVTKWHDKGVTPKELSFVKSYLSRSHVFELDTAHKRASRQLEADVLHLPEGYHASYLPRVKATTKEACDAAIRLRVSPPDLVIAVVGTYAEIGPSIEAAAGPGTRVDVVPFDIE